MRISDWRSDLCSSDLLPIALVESLGLATPIGSTLIGLVFLAVLSIGEDLTDPFANSVHDVPLPALCPTIEIDLLQTAGLPAPEPLPPDHGVLWGGRDRQSVVGGTSVSGCVDLGGS